MLQINAGCELIVPDSDGGQATPDTWRAAAVAKNASRYVHFDTDGSTLDPIKQLHPFAPRAVRDARWICEKDPDSAKPAQEQFASAYP